MELWLSELDELGRDPASLSKLLYLNTLDPKLANHTVLLFFMRIADGLDPLASPVRNYSARLMTTCSKAIMSLEDCGEQKQMGYSSDYAALRLQDD